MAKRFLTPINLTNLSSDPATGSEGDLYFNTTENVVKIYADGAWTELTGGAGAASVYYQPEAPDEAELGALWVDSDSTGTGGSSGGGGSGTSLLFWTEDSDGNLIPDVDNVYSIGSSAYRVKDLYLGASSLYLQNPANASANISLSVDSNGNLKINDSKIITESNANNNLNLTNYATLEYARSASAAAVSYLVDSAPGALDTLNELANALGDDQNFATTITNVLSSKLSISSASSTYQLKDSITSISENHNAQDNETIFVNSASSSINVTLPSSPNTGSKIKVLDVAANAQNNNITVLGNGNNIGGASAYIINTPDSSVEVMYINAIKGWNILNEYISISKPGVPTGILATDVGTNRPYNNGAATVQFSPDTSGDAASSYTVVSTPGGITSTGATSPIIVTGLQSNTSYTFKVFATNAAGSSAESNASGSITATTVPQAPVIGTATDVGTNRAYNNGAASVTFTSGATGGSAITSYTVTSNIGGYTGTGASSPVTATGLQSDSPYTFTVTATNANGTSAASTASNSITATTVPQAPTINSTTYGFEHVSVAFTANATGGKAISGYTATSNPGSVSASASSSPIKVSTLTAGTAYTFTATAANANGTSAASTASSSATPFTATGGSIATYSGFRSHTYTGTSNFTVTGNSAIVDYLVVAGGGAGGRSSGYNGSGTGGGGAGGVIVRTSQTFPTAIFTCTIGGGGGQTGGVGGTGGISTIIGTGLATVSSTGGGGGGRTGGGGATSGASGGGGGGTGTYAGDGDATTFGNNSGGLGGGGAGAASSGTAGGIGLINAFRDSTSIYYGGGGSGGQYGTSTPGGLGGGGTGAQGSYGNGRTGGSDGGANTGGGGGGVVEENDDHNGFNGGSGIIVIRYAV